jgi:hypothetical protein
MRVKFMVLLIGSSLALLGAMVGPSYSEISVELKQEPPGVAEISATAAPKLSEVGITINMDFKRLSTIINQFKFKINSTAGVFVGTLIVDKIRIESNFDKMRPLDVTAPFSFSGAISGSEYKNEKGEVRVQLGVVIGKNWCPGLEIGNPSVELDNPGLFGIKEWLATTFLKTEMQNFITCDTLKAAIGRAWSVYEFPLMFGQNTLFVNINPSAISFTDVVVDNGRVLFKAIIQAAALLKTKASGSIKLSLPAEVGHLEMPGKPGVADAEGVFRGDIVPDFH